MTFAGTIPITIARPISPAATGSSRIAYGLPSRCSVIFCPTNTGTQLRNSSSFPAGVMRMSFSTSAVKRSLASDSPFLTRTIPAEIPERRPFPSWFCRCSLVKFAASIKAFQVDALITTGSPLFTFSIASPHIPSPRLPKLP